MGGRAFARRRLGPRCAQLRKALGIQGLQAIVESCDGDLTVLVDESVDHLVVRSLDVYAAPASASRCSPAWSAVGLAGCAAAAARRRGRA
jgi:hypothetical protein